MVSLLAVERGLSPLQAFEAVMGFARLRGEYSLNLALHASVPQVLHVDILQLLRLNFVDAINPEVTVNDVLFATFCIEMGNGYFRFDDNARIQLLQQFEGGNPDSSSGQAVRVADFLLTYLGRELTSERCDRDPVYRSWLEIERWNALAFRDPEATAEQLAAAVKQACDPAHASARLRVGKLATSLATPLACHHRLLRYAAGLEALQSQAADAAEKLQVLRSDPLQVGSVSLPGATTLLERQVVSRQQGFEDDLQNGSDKHGPQAFKRSEQDHRRRFSIDVFISYAHIDNMPLTPEQQGWITRFHQALQGLLSVRLGRDARIWRDDKLGGNDVFVDKILQTFMDAALFIPILTPRYINSEWCTHEAREFCQAAEKTGGLVVENKSRVLKVVKTPIDTLDSLPNAFKSVLGYDFYALEEGKPLELDPEYGDKFEQDYLRKVADLANDAAALIRMLEAEGPSPEKDAIVSETKNATIYLAESSSDQREARENLIADLKLNGYVVVPAKPLPLDDEAAYRAAAKALLQASSLSIHLVGATPGATPDGPSLKSIGVLQNELAAQASREGTLKRVIWLPSGTRSENEQQQAFIEALHQDAEAQAGAVLITGGLEEMKSTIYRKLNAIQQASYSQGEPTELPKGKRSQLVYLVCNEKDRKATVPLRKWLIDQGMEVKLPLFGSFPKDDIPDSLQGGHSGGLSEVRIFLSTVSAEFKTYRENLRHAIDRPGVTVKVQEDFISSGTPTLDMIDTYIKQCDGVIHLVGDMTGAMAKPKAVEVITARYSDQLKKLPIDEFLRPGGPSLSYTQWEAWLAVLHGKKLFIAIPAEGAPRDPLYVLDPEQRSAQQQHLVRLKQEELFPGEPFTSEDHLSKLVLRSFILDSLVKATSVELEAVREANESLLAICDAVLLFYGAGDEAWKNAIDSDHRKIRALRGVKPLPPRFTYLAEPITEHKQDMIDMEEDSLINGMAGFDGKSMGEFLQAVRKQGVSG